MEKKIEEMAKDLGSAWVVDLEGNPHDLSEVLMQCDIESISEQLCEIGYRKITEGVTVLTRAELDALTEYEEKTKGEIAKEIINEISASLHDMAMSYANAGIMDYYALCDLVHHRVIEPIEKKYTDREAQNDTSGIV